MQRKVMLLAAMGILAMATSAVLAEKVEGKAGKTKEMKAEKAAKAEKAEKGMRADKAKSMQDLFLTGVISKDEKTNAKGEKSTVYVLTDDAGVVTNLPKAEKAGVKLEDFVGGKVTVVGKGMKHETKDGTKIMVKVITSVEKSDEKAEPAEAPAEKAAE